MKKLFSLLFIGVIAAVAYWARPAQAELNNLLLENIEALAAGEGSGTIHCVGTGSVDCPINHSQVYFVAGGYSLEALY